MKNTLCCGDNLDVLRKHIKDESIDLIYIDPPFFNNRHYEVVWGDEAGIQVKQSDGVGRNVIDNFKAALERKKYKKGYIVAFSFTKGSHEESARIKHDEGLDIKLVEVEASLLKKKPIE